MTDPAGPDAYLDKSATAGRMGKASELLTAATAIISTRGQINVSTAVLDDDGIDLIFSRRGHPETLSVQVKTRFSDSTQVQRGQFSIPIREETFAPAPDVYVLGVIVDVGATAISHAWFIPSEIINNRLTPNGQNRRVVTASAKPETKDQWARYRVVPNQLGAHIGTLLTSLQT
ncbi:MAG: hypothetical protein ACYDC9_07335 [Dermatophilaceae bacterium]